MEVVHKLIDDICNLIGCAESMNKHRENLHTVIKQCEAMGFVHVREIMEMTQVGLPVVATYSAIQRVTNLDGLKKIENKEMSYSDLLCVIGIIAQDLLSRSQANSHKSLSRR